MREFFWIVMDMLFMAAPLLLVVGGMKALDRFTRFDTTRLRRFLNKASTVFMVLLLWIVSSRLFLGDFSWFYGCVFPQQYSLAQEIFPWALMLMSLTWLSVAFFQSNEERRLNLLIGELVTWLVIALLVKGNFGVGFGGTGSGITGYVVYSLFIRFWLIRTVWQKQWNWVGVFSFSWAAELMRVNFLGEPVIDLRDDDYNTIEAVDADDSVLMRCNSLYWRNRAEQIPQYSIEVPDTQTYYHLWLDGAKQ